MIAIPELLIEPANKANIKVPNNLEDYNKDDYPHWFTYCSVQLGAPMPSPTSHWTNAQIIGALTDEEIKSITYQELMEKGLEIGYSK